MDLPEEIYEEFLTLDDNDNPKQEDNTIESAVPVLELDPLNPECDFLSLCRICLAIDKNVHSFVQEDIGTVNEDSLPLPHIFTSFTNIQFNTDERLPTRICKHCAIQLIRSYEFRNKCLQSYHTLTSLLNPVTICKNTGDIEAINDTKPPVLYPEVSLPPPQEKTEVIPQDASSTSDDVQYLEDFDSDQESIIKQEEKYEIDETLIDQTSEVKQMLNINDENIGKKRKPRKSTKPICDFCSKRFKTKQELTEHLSLEHSELDRSKTLTIKCTKCTESFASSKDLRIHSAVHTGKGDKWTCIECSKTFNQKSLLARHIRRHMEYKRHACPECGKRFAERYALVRHSRVHTGERPEARFQCNLCENRFVDRYKLSQHISTHTDSKPFICARCGNRFRTEMLLKSHSLVHSDNKPFKCQYCDKKFRHESARNIHHRTHTGERPYVCSICGKVFIQQCNLSLHMRVHTGEKPYTCLTCNKSFSSCSTLKSHIFTHTGEKPYSCKLCGKSFSRTGLHAHSRTHAHMRAFPCGVCTHRFVSAARLREHERVHTGEKPFQCEDCKMKFTTKSQLVKHLRKHASKPKTITKSQKVHKPKKRVKFVDKKPEEVELTLDESQIHIINANNQIVHLQDDEMISVHSIHEHPTEVSGELILEDDGEVKSELVMIDESQNQGEVCLTDSVQFLNSDELNINYANDIDLVTVNEGEILSSNQIEGTTVKLYQLDQSLVQIHRTGAQVTISKITSKVTANF